MARQKSQWGAKNVIALLVLSYLCFFFIPVLLAVLTNSLNFVLVHAPFFLTALVFALVPTLVCRMLFVEEVPEKMLGVLVDHNGNFKSLLLPGNYFILPGSERITDLLLLEPTPVQMPLLGLKASDGDAPPQVVIFTWRIQPDMSQALRGPFQQQIQQMIVAGHRQMEQKAREYLEAAFRQRVQRRTLSALQADLADIQHPLEQEVIAAANTWLVSLGLTIDQLELLSTGAVKAGPVSSKPGKAAEEAQKLIAQAHKKLSALLRPAVEHTTALDVTRIAWVAHQMITQVRSDISEISAALQVYNNAVLDTLETLAQQAKKKPDAQPVSLARKEAAERLNKLQNDIGALGQLVIDVEKQAKQIKAPPFDLTPSEVERLLEVLQAIERKLITLEKLYP